MNEQGRIYSKYSVEQKMKSVKKYKQAKVENKLKKCQEGSKNDRMNHKRKLKLLKKINK